MIRTMTRSCRILSASLLAAALLVLATALAAEAQCVQGNCVNGKGVKVTRGHVYEGEFVNNHRQGFGVYTFPDGSVYRGHFVNGAMEGEGEYAYQDGTVYKGTFKNNKRNGQGTYYFKDGTFLSGLWENNVLVMEGEGLVTTGLELDEADLDKPAQPAGNASEAASPAPAPDTVSGAPVNPDALEKFNKELEDTAEPIDDTESEPGF